MVRQFADRPLAPEAVERILASALRAPSAGFAQGWAFLERYAQPDKGWQDKAEAKWPAPYWYIDTGMAERRRGVEQVVHRGQWGS